MPNVVNNQLLSMTIYFINDAIISNSNSKQVLRTFQL